MHKGFLAREVAGAPSGFLASIALFLVAIISAGVVAVDLPTIKSFTDIAWPTTLGIVFAVVSAVISVLTVRKQD